MHYLEFLHIAFCVVFLSQAKDSHCDRVLQVENSDFTSGNHKITPDNHDFASVKDVFTSESRDFTAEYSALTSENNDLTSVSENVNLESKNSPENIDSEAVNNVDLATENHNFVLENGIGQDVQAYILRIVSDMTKGQTEDIKHLKASMEAQRRQIEALEKNKQSLTSFIKTLGERIEHLEKQTPGDKCSKGHDHKFIATPEANGIVSAIETRDPAQQQIQIPSRMTVQGHRIRRAGVGGRIAFFARLLTKSQRVVKGQTVIFDNVVTNIGGSYNGSSGEFVVPSLGTYVFSITTGKLYGDDTFAELVLNGVPVIRVIVSEEQSTQNIVLNLKPGDVLALQNTEIERDYIGDGFSSFSGFMLYDDVSVSPIVG